MLQSLFNVTTKYHVTHNISAKTQIKIETSLFMTIFHHIWRVIIEYEVLLVVKKIVYKCTVDLFGRIGIVHLLLKLMNY